MVLCKNSGSWCSCKHHQKLKAQGYKNAREDAQKYANETGYDFGLEWLGGYGGWHVFMLPARHNRFGYEKRCEVVSCDDVTKQQPGHGSC